MSENRFFDDQDDQEWSRRIKEEFAKAKQGIGEKNKEFGELMKLLNQSASKELKEIKEYTKIMNVLKESMDFNELEAMTGSGLTKKQRQIQDKYNYLKNEMMWDPDVSDGQKAYYMNEYDKMEAQDSQKAYEESPLGEIGEVMSKSFSQGLQDMIKGYKDFSEITKDITNNMMNYLIKEMSDSLSSVLFSEDNMKMIAGLLGGVFNWGGGVLGSAGGFLTGIFKKHHSGGIVPVGANAQLPGTQEQLALLKGGERILSPGENTSYNSESGGSNVVFNNFNVKAWDSKDVSKYLLENRTLLNQITFQGIKDNDSHLRTMVRNA